MPERNDDRCAVVPTGRSTYETRYRLYEMFFSSFRGLCSMPQPTPSGNQIKIAGDVHFRQENAKIAAMKDGGFIAVWQRAGVEGQVIQAQIYNADGTKRGGEFTISASSEKRTLSPDVTVLTDGRILVAWESTSTPTSEYQAPETDIFAQLYSPDGNQIGGGFSANGILGEHVDRTPTVTALANGEFAIAWSDFAPAPRLPALSGTNTRKPATSTG
ncbi:hypothetical protein JKG68_18315 [Microvirga aerilata]|uniref:Uncharacterized protein n=1 Tax=Microvirga aerilata TaxID=670292 RepID=A0A937D1F3_9HYPH|nr:hypothetical protein [Microvirga aerilata]MBL0405917.1 hypothetical protein [Microvirga aerilata]